MKKLIFILLIISGCGSKKTTTDTTIIKDTTSTKSFEYVSEPIQTTIAISDICDSLGNVRKFTQVETSGLNKAKVSTQDNKLTLDLFTGLSKTKTDTIYKTRYRDREYKEEEVRYKVSPWHWVVHLASIIIIFVVIKFRSLLPF